MALTPLTTYVCRWNASLRRREWLRRGYPTVVVGAGFGGTPPADTGFGRTPFATGPFGS